MTTLTITTRKDLRFVIGMHVAQPARDVAAEQLGVVPKLSGDHVELEFGDPLDALLGWRQLDRRFREYADMMSVIASPAALEMLRDPSELARESFAALTGRTQGEPDPAGMFIVTTLRGPRYRRFVDAREPKPGGIVLCVIDDEKQRIQELAQPGWIGRFKNAPIQIGDAEVNKRHIELGVDSHEGWFARDSGSDGGWYIANRHAGAKRYALHPGMVLQLGGPHTAVVVIA